MQQSHGRVGESVLFQPVLKAYPTCHSQIVTADVSLGNLEKQWRMFIRQRESVASIAIIQIATTSISSVMHAIANHYIMTDGTDSVYRHLHLYQTCTHY